MSSSIDQALARLGPSVRADVPLGSYTTYRVGGPAAAFIEIESDSTLDRVADAVSATGVATLVVGNGSNLLVSDRGFDGLAVLLGSAYGGVSITGRRVRAGAAALLPVLARRTADAGLTGLEWAVGVPGSVGGAVRMNAGGHGSDVAASLVQVRVFDLATGKDEVMAAAALDLSYRKSTIGPSDVVVWAEFELRDGDATASRREIADIVHWRRANQPGGANAGSVFTNPSDDSAGRLIESVGGKGLRVGTAVVSDKHANFILVDENGSADDVRRLMVVLARRVVDATGVRLEPETRLIGFEPWLAPGEPGIV